MTTLLTIIIATVVICAGAVLIAWIIFQFKEYVIPEFRQLFKALKKRVKEVSKKR